MNNAGGVTRKETYPSYSRLRLRTLPIAICLLWGGNVVAMRVALLELPPLWTSGIRTVLATLTLLVYAYARRGRIHLHINQVAPIIVVSLLTTSTYALVYLALDRTSASHVAVLLYLYPIFIAALAHGYLPQETLTIHAATGLLLGFAGAILTLSDVQSHAPGTSFVGDVLAVGSTGAWVLSTVYIKRHLPAEEPIFILLCPTALSAIALVGMASVLEPYYPKTLSWLTMSALVYQGVLATAATSLGWLILMRRSPANVISTYYFLTPTFGVLASVILLGEPFAARLILGLALVLLGLATIEKRSRNAIIANRCLQRRPNSDMK